MDYRVVEGGSVVPVDTRIITQHPLTTPPSCAQTNRIQRNTQPLIFIGSFVFVGVKTLKEGMEATAVFLNSLASAIPKEEASDSTGNYDSLF